MEFAASPVRPTPRQLDNEPSFIDKQDAVGILLKLFQQRLKPFSKSPRYLVPASSEPISSE